MKRILTTMCALTLLLAASVPALAVEPEQSASYYPTSVEEYMEGDSPRIKKVYQLSLADDPSQIPTEDFERDGRLYYLLDMTRKDEVGVDIQTITQTKTLASETNNMEKILQSLEPQMEVTTEDGYTGTLTLYHCQGSGRRLCYPDKGSLRHPHLSQSLGSGCIFDSKEH